jgi:HK97 family phage major capsid protein
MTMKNIYVKETTDLSGFSQENVAKLGKIAWESMQKSPKYKKQVEELKTMKEEGLNITETDLFTTAVAGFIEKKLRPELVAAQVIKTIDNFDTKGQNALKVPIRTALITAADLPDSGEVTYDTGSFSSTTITLSYKYASQRITHEILKFANVDLIAEELGEIGDALSRKVDSDIIAALEAATGTAAGNSNFTALSVGTYVTYSSLVDALAAAKALYAKPDVILINPSSTATIMKTDEFAGGSSLVGSLAFKGADGVNFPYVQTILNMRLVESTQVDDNDIYLVDSARTGYLVKAGGVETFDGRISGALAYEVIGALNYGVTVVQPASVYRIIENEESGA